MRRMLPAGSLAMLLLVADARAQPRPRAAPNTQRPGSDAGAPAEAPEVSPHPSPLLRALESRREAFLACYESARAERPDLRGTVTLRLRVGPGGRVMESQASGIDGADGFLQCLEGHTLGIQLEGVPRGTAYSIPLDFHPDG